MGNLVDELAELYEIGEQLDACDVGALYNGRDARTQQPVTLRVYDQTLTESQLRVLRDVWARVEPGHVAVPTLIHALRTPSGRGVMVTEAMDGETLMTRIARRGALPIAEARGVGHTIARALAAAHARDTAHGALDPNNVVLLTNQRVKVIDFGLHTALAIDDADPGSALLYRSHAHASPEQLSGRVTGSPAADVYSLGCVLFHAITGRPPFHGPMVELMQQQMFEPPPPLGVGEPELEGLIQHMLAKEPEKRPDASDVADVLAASFPK